MSNTSVMPHSIGLSGYCHGAGCGCTFSPKVLDGTLVWKLSIAMDARIEFVS